MMSIIKTYSDILQIPSFLDRYRYLRIGNKIGEETFGFDRWINQKFYRNDSEWLEIRDYVIVRDNGYDLAHEDMPIKGSIIVHHINPITKDDILNRTKLALDPEYLISVSDITHKAIHYGNEDLLFHMPIERRPNDTCPWRH